ncbi:phosphoglycerate mutase-like protein [Testicularia cyperi]|uniref:Phosphoglycerate mutase-like protein n=1 Tax=Testicularia cyperi TaxID=1882483 RepID=A0A317XQR9_9BASI|nr:phosphoglycerate mutase-like protein [Testicularia cyperi]
MTSSPVAGIVALIRHGDRQGFYQSPTTYTASHTNLTVLGYLQELNSGAQLRSLYLNSSSPSAIQGIDVNLAENLQVSVQADAGGEGGVIVESANAFMQGLFPPFNDTLTLANGTTVSWDTRAQLIPVETIEPDQSWVMEPWTSCDNFDDWTNSFYTSDAFKAQSKIAQPFYDSLPSTLLNNRPKTLVNAWNVFDFLNVERIHNATLSSDISSDTLSNALSWAEYHESGVFSSSEESSIGNIAGRGILTPLTEAITDVANTSNPLKVSVLAASYKPFFSLFSMFQIDALQGHLVDYASSMVFQIHQDNTIQLYFRNGSYGSYDAYPLLKSDSMSVADFSSHFNQYKIDTLAEWCNVCGETSARGCDTLNALNGTGSGSKYSDVTSTVGKHQVSPVVAGVIGALVSLALALVLVALVSFLTGLTVVKRSKAGAYTRRNHLLAPGSTSTVHRQDNSVELRSNIDRKDSHLTA